MIIRTKRDALRRYNTIIRQCYRDLKGGLEYGLDWPTLRITFPERYAEIQSLKAMFKGLPS